MFSLKAKVDELKKLISIIIINYNTRDITLDCINSIFSHGQEIKLEVVLWDNASTDGSRAVFSKIKKIKYIYSAVNVGFAKANNCAMREASGEYILYLNSDTVIQPHFFRELLRDYTKLLEKEDCALAPTLLNKDGSIQKSFFQFPTVLKSTVGALGLHPLSVRFLHFLKNEDSKSFYKKKEPIFTTDYAILACLLIRKEFVDLVDGLDENYFFYHDDCDFGYKLLKNGVSQYVTKSARVIHLGGASSSKHNMFRIEHYYKSLLCFYQKHRS